MNAAAGELRSALHQLAVDRTRRPLLVALDFDGTLAPLQDDPATSRMLPDAATALAEVGDVPATGIHLALVSGRRLGDLHALASPLPVGTLLVGSHGAERGLVGADGALVLDETEGAGDAEAHARARATHLADRLDAANADRDGVWVERKPYNVVVHTRLADPAASETAAHEALAVGAAEGVKVVVGKDVVELGLVSTDKGEALEQLRETLGAAAVLYAGDDRTDEDAFAALDGGDVAIKVGPGETVAPLRAADPSSFCAELLVFVREAVAVAG